MNKYPYLKVIFCHFILGSILGTIIGGFLFLFYVFLLFKGETLNSQWLVLFVFSFVFSATSSAIPALLSGIIIAVSKTYHNNNNRKTKTALIGFFVSTIFVSITLISDIKNSNDLSMQIMKILIFGSISGAMSSYIIGEHILPKQPLQIRE